MEDHNVERTCCFFGHRKVPDSEELRARLRTTIEDLIVNHSIDTFLFGSKSDFDTLCLEAVTDLKELYPFIRRIYVRAEYQHISDSYYRYLLKKGYDDTYFPKCLENAGRASYIKRNQEIINNSQFCIIYYDETYRPPKRKNRKQDITDYQPKSGTALAYKYAKKKKRDIMNIREICLLNR